MKYDFLEPIKVGGVQLKNRVIYAAQGKYMCTEDGFITERYVEYYRTLARGGVGLITPGLCVIDPDWPYTTHFQPHLNDDKYIPGLKQTVDAVHEEGGKITYQLWHPGESIKDDSVHHTTVNEFTLYEIRAKQKLFVDAAMRCKKAGADGIEFHLAHIYMPNQFFSPAFNHRTDEYGSGTLENSLRFSTEILDEIARICRSDGKPFMINVKINGNDFVKGGTTPERTADAVPILEKHHVDLIIVNAGGIPSGGHGCFETGQEQEGWKVPYAAAARRKATVPVAANGTIRHPDFAHQIIRDGKADMVCIGRGLVAEPEWVKKCMEGREDELRYCINCIYCMGVHSENESGCSVNPYSKREARRPKLVQNGNGRTIAVIGAGPAGLECAVVLAERGFKPVVFDSEAEIGGLVRYASLPPYKSRLRWMLDSYRKQIVRLGIDVRLNTTATSGIISELNPTAVVVASGSNELRPAIPGIEYALSVRKCLDEPLSARGKKIVVLGGSDTGLETAHLYQMRGNQVTVVEMLPVKEKPDMALGFRLNEMNEDGVVIYNEMKVVKLEEHAIYVEHVKTGERHTLEADFVICALGVRPNDKIIEDIRNAMPDLPLYNIGDSAACGRIAKAVQEGSECGYDLLL